MINLTTKQFTLNGSPVTFFHAVNDDTIFGTLSCLGNDKFSLSKVTFKPGDVFVDIGCNVGLLSLVVAKANPDVRVLAFDASPLAIECLRRSAAENKMTNIQAFQVAVGGESAKGVRFYSNNKDTSCLVQEGLNKDNKTYEATVDMIAIDEIFDSALLGVDRVRYQKMDIEGGEHSVFAHLFAHRQDILDRVDYLHLEVHNYEEYDPIGLEEKVRAQWGERVFFDT